MQTGLGRKARGSNRNMAYDLAELFLGEESGGAAQREQGTRRNTRKL